MSKRQKNVEFDIEYWRERFAQTKAISPKNWMKCLAKFNPGYDTHEGSLSMIAVANNRAGLAKTAQLVADLEEMLATPAKATSTYEKWKKKELITK